MEFGVISQIPYSQAEPSRSRLITRSVKNASGSKTFVFSDSKKSFSSFMRNFLLASGPPSGSLGYTAARFLYYPPVPPRLLASGPPSGSLGYTAARFLYYPPVPPRLLASGPPSGSLGYTAARISSRALYFPPVLHVPVGPL